MKPKFRTLENIGSSVWKLVILECMMSKVNSSEFSVVDVRVTAIVVITVSSPVAVTALSLDYECVICVFVMGDSNNWKNNT